MSEIFAAQCKKNLVALKLAVNLMKRTLPETVLEIRDCLIEFVLFSHRCL